MVTIDADRCKKCGTCLKICAGYCMEDRDGLPAIDYDICNQCQKCIAVCPHQAILMNGTPPADLAEAQNMDYEALMAFMSRRRSTKRFQDKAIPREIVRRIAASAKYAPNQNKNIGILAVDEPELIGLIDREAVQMVQSLHRLMFACKPVTALISLFFASMRVIKKKMERDTIARKTVVKQNTQAILLCVGDSRVPTTEASAQYLLAFMGLAAESLGVGSTLMDSIKLTFRLRGKLRRRFGLAKKDRVLGALTLGYSAEGVRNIPQGYEVPLSWNNLQREAWNSAQKRDPHGG